MTDVVGTPYYMAPEVFKGEYSQPADMWSVGVILYSMLSGMPPFWHEEEAGVYRAVTEGKYDIESGPWTEISDEAKDLVSRLLVGEPAHRLTALQFLCQYNPRRAGRGGRAGRSGWGNVYDGMYL